MPGSAVDRPDPVMTIPARSPWRRSRLVERTTFFEQLRRAVDRNQGVAGGLAVVAVALDPFVVTNPGDEWTVRDDVRLVTAGRITGCLHHSHITTRNTSDEFLVLAEGIGDTRRAVDLAEQVRMAVRWPEMLRDESTAVTVSVGIAFPETAMSAEQVYSNAAVAMYAARGAGGDRVHLFGDHDRDLAVPARTA